MQKLTANDPETKSPELAAENLARLRALFPELVTEGPNGVAINLDVLKTLVGDKTVTDAEEKYGLNWHGKRRARQLALTPSTGTLRPCPEDSVDWDTTLNLMMGQTGGGTTYSSGTVTSGTQMGSFSGTSTTMPTYGIVGGMPMQITQFKREVNIDIYKRNQDRRWNKVYEIKAASVGSCGNINSVIRPIIDAIFWNFHEQSGVTYRSRPYLYNPC